MSVQDQIVKQNLAFVYGRSKEDEKHDPDKRSYVKSVKPLDNSAQLGPPITSFVGEFESLHPAYKCNVVNALDRSSEGSRNIIYTSFEHALMASKLLDVDKKLEIVQMQTIQEVKRFVSKELKKEKSEVQNWKDKCLEIGERLLRDKFMRNKLAKSALAKTIKRPLTFINDYKDLFWGVDNEKKGQNHLGLLLSKIREDVSKGEDVDAWLERSLYFEKADNVSISVEVKKAGVVEKEASQVLDRKSVVFIGKHESCDIISAHPSTSRTHAAIVVDKELGAVLVDLHSANGTMLNGVALPPCEFVPLTPQSTVSIGASSRSYHFTVETQAGLKRQQLLLQRLSSKQQEEENSQKSGRNNDTTVFVRNLAYETTEAQLADFFAPCGNVTHISVPRDRGIAFVTFSSLSGVLQAVGKDGDELQGRQVRIKRSDANAASSGKGKPTHPPGPIRSSRARGGVDSAIYGPGDTTKASLSASRTDKVTSSSSSSSSSSQKQLKVREEEEVEYDYSYYMQRYGLVDETVANSAITDDKSHHEKDESPPRRPVSKKRGSELDVQDTDASPPRRKK